MQHAKRQRSGPVLAALLATALLPAHGSAAPTSAITEPSIFEDVTRAAGLAFVHDDGGSGELHLPEVMGPGCALFDMDGDGDLDAYLVQGGRIAGGRIEPAAGGGRLFRNDLMVGPDGRRELRFTDVTVGSGTDLPGYGMGVAAGDFDGDGRVDLYLTRFGPNRLLRNLGGGRFEDATGRAGVGEPGWSVSAAFADVDRDGRLDLFVVNYVEYPLADPVRCFAASSRRDYCGPAGFEPLRARLYRNLGDGRFEDASRRWLGAHQPGAGLGVATVDLDGDGWIDVYIANDGDPNHLWLNQQGKGFREDGLLAGVAVNRAGLPEAGMGVEAADLDGDGDEDLVVTNLTAETNTLYANLGGGAFEDRTAASGLGPPSLPLTGFGTALPDVDNDGRPDLVVVNGAVKLPADPAAGLGQPSLLFMNTSDRGGLRFADVSARSGLDAPGRPTTGRGLAVGDVDEDGDPDLLIATHDGPARLLLNRIGQRAPWLGLRLLTGQRDALGARVVLRRRGASDLWRRARSDGSYASASDPRVLFGLAGGGEVAGVEVIWPDGRRERFPAPPAGRYTTLRQGTGEALPEAPR